MSEMYICKTFARTVLQNGVFNPFENLVGELKLRALRSVDDYIGEFYQTWWFHYTLNSWRH